jgi:hypothetical protein
MAPEDPKLDEENLSDLNAYLFWQACMAYSQYNDY